MTDTDRYLEKITQKKLTLEQGLLAIEKVKKIIRVIDLSYTYAQNSPDISTLDAAMQERGISASYRSQILCSSRDKDGLITIPGIFSLIYKISDEIRIIAHEISCVTPLLASDEDRRPDLIRERLFSIARTIRDPDYVFHNPDLSLLRESGDNEGDGLMGSLVISQTIFEEAIQSLIVQKEYGAFCYNISNDDRFMVRSFMQGVRSFSSDESDSDLLTLFYREGKRLFIGLFQNSLVDQYFVIEIEGMMVKISIFGLYPHLLSSVSSLSGQLQIVWRKHELLNNQEKGLDCVVPPLTGTFYARSSVEMMQYLSVIGYHLKNFRPDF